jgi:ABC-type transport system substrate-binding protein
VPAEHVQRTGERLRVRPLSSGPFALESWNEGEKLVLTRNPFYWNPELPYVDGIAMHLLLSRDVARLRFLRGEIDTLDRIAADDYARFARMPAWEPYMFRSPAMGYFAEVMNTRRPPFDDRRVRQAMNYAIDREDLIKLANGLAVPAHGPLPPGMLGYDSTRKPYPYDPERARQLLAEAGYPDGFEVTYSVVQDEWGEKIAQSIQADLAKVGVKMKIQRLTFPVYATAVGKGELPFAFSGWLMDFPDPWNFLEVKFHSRMIANENSNNDSFYSNPDLDRLLDEARREQDRERRAELYRRAEEILFEDAPNVWRFHAMRVEARHPYVMNYQPHPVWLRDYRRTWLDLPRSERVAR